MGRDLGLSILDLSERGVRLMVKEDLVVGLEVVVVLEGSTNARPVKRTGKVVWSLAAATGNHCVGISFQKRIEHRDFLILT